MQNAKEQEDLAMGQKQEITACSLINTMNNKTTTMQAQVFQFHLLCNGTQGSLRGKRDEEDG